MWLMEYITQNSISSPNAARGNVNRNDNGGSMVSASGDHLNVKMCAPYGITSIPPVGESAVVIPLEFGEVGVGVVADTVGLEEGELRLRSKGGAEILLKNDGRVLINGREM